MVEIIDIDKQRLEKMTDHEYDLFCRQIVAFEFCSRSLFDRFEYETKDRFIEEMFWAIFTDGFICPLHQILFTYSQMKSAKPKDRWKYVSEYSWSMFCEYEKIKTYEEKKEYFDKHFYNEFNQEKT